MADEVTSDGLVCLACEGTGSRAAMRLLRAYRRGFDDGVDAQRRAMIIVHEPLGLAALWEICDDAGERTVSPAIGAGTIGDGGGVE